MSLTCRRWVISAILLLEAGLFFFQLYLALGTSDVVLNRMPEITAVAEYLQPFVPALRGYTQQSHFPRVTIVFYTISFLLLPVQILAFTLYNYLAGQLPHAPRLPIRMALLALVTLLALLVSLFLLPKDSSIVGSLGPSQSRLGLAIFGVGQFLFVWLIAGTLIGEAFILLRDRLVR